MINHNKVVILSGIVYQSDINFIHSLLPFLLLFHYSRKILHVLHLVDHLSV